ncbi:sigma-70 family RNA polymerase sigma factor [Petralouisia muris]|uniref:Sigma-70 family RNA polymerase sigma factor n=1 Tax=Petralouisia muris TaxID=3032872 RepID=A0AC61RQ79_9FIRM|nr:sigma-70 family RNA polymerase sigma factor [Petralouisia muris]TGY88703.1 sigma-70 family RNA polymerase sigma factor [Petralouisia muris]
MAYNKAKEEWKWKQWKEKEEEQLRALGTDEKVILELRRRDWEEFKSERRYLEHRAAFPEYADWEGLEIEEQEVTGIPALLDSINDERLLHILLDSDRRTLQMLLLKMMGFSVAEIAVKLRTSERAVYCRIDRLKKKIKKIL